MLISVHASALVIDDIEQCLPARWQPSLDRIVYRTVEKCGDAISSKLLFCHSSFLNQSRRLVCDDLALPFFGHAVEVAIIRLCQCRSGKRSYKRHHQSSYRCVPVRHGFSSVSLPWLSVKERQFVPVGQIRHGGSVRWSQYFALSMGGDQSVRHRIRTPRRADWSSVAIAPSVEAFLNL